MNAQRIRPEILEPVRRCVAESLALPAADIELQSRLVDDLGANSLDFIDIVFNLEREIGIRVRDTEFNFLTRLDFSSPEVMQQGFLVREVVDRLAEWLPAMAQVPDRNQVSPRTLFSLITVEAMCLVAQRHLDQMAQSTPTAEATP